MRAKAKPADRRCLFWPELAGSLVLVVALLGGCANRDVRPQSSAQAGGSQTGLASFYSDYHQGHKTASGERFDQNSLTAAHRSLAFGSRVKVTNLDNGRQVTVRINDRGPFAHGRIIDVSRSAAQKLGMVDSGTAHVRITPQ